MGVFTTKRVVMHRAMHLERAANTEAGHVEMVMTYGWRVMAMQTLG